MSTIRACFIVTMLFVLFHPIPSWAWGREGHEIVARIAEARLSPHVRAELKSLLHDAGATHLEDVASWADDVKSRDTARRHFVNLSPGCRYDPARNCPNGDCLPAAIENEIHVLADAKARRAERVDALRWLVHLVGDAFQPLHAGDANDRGGLRYQVNLNGRGTNLHVLWDREVVEHLRKRCRLADTRCPSEGQPKRDIVRRWTPRETTASPTAWVEQACAITHETGFYPGRKVGDDYLDRMAPIAQQQLANAGAALAEALTQALSKHPAAAAKR